MPDEGRSHSRSSGVDVSGCSQIHVPREVVEHLLDWHNKQPCGAGQESYDEVIFGVLRDALGPVDEGAYEA